eukprot:CAMPEP_0197935704 /NCGR_PEP_ID=MMETSP1439-20131203/113771_1 /TAXON_ID=66791 /ORGANISM="Gonyaulax spinifera, Strain CCMP409" /LENGTH=224 /DNA_ID=CAMNT_0043558655 /DNA_START=44 /DNA_END=718 /DNA_ORIENTATION=-
MAPKAMAPKAAKTKSPSSATAKAKGKVQAVESAPMGKVHGKAKLRVRAKTFDSAYSSAKVGVVRRPAGAMPVPPSSSSTEPTSFVVALLFYNDLQAGALQYKALGTLPSVAAANKRVGQELAKWKEEDARPACEEHVRYLEGEDRAAEMKRLVHSSVAVSSKKDRGMLVVTASIKGLDLMGSSNHWRWRPLPAGSDLAAAATDFWRELPGRPVGADAPIPHPFV